MTTERHDATNAPTTPFVPTAHHESMSALAGRWAGETKLWLDPTKPPETSLSEATIEPLLGGRWIRIDHRGTAMGAPHAGVMILGFHKDAGVFEVSWIDSFHTGSSILMSVGEPRDDGAISVLGSYAAGEERWGWRTVVRRDGDALMIEAFNILPTGEEAHAISTRFARRPER